MPAAVSASVRKRAAEATLMLPFRLEPAKQWFSLQEAAKVIGLKESAVEKLYDKGELTGHSHNAGSGLRDRKRIRRDSLAAYMVRTADYDDESLGDALVDALPHLPAEALLRIAAQAQALAYRISPAQPAKSA